VTIRVRAPATTANLGPAFDAAGVALDLWNELEIHDGEGIEIRGEGAAELPRDRTHLGVRAFELVAPADGHRFVFTNRIPLAGGLGSSAAAVALGLVAGARVARAVLDPERLLGLGVELEGHADNLAAALAGGVCLTWEGHIARIADDVPAVPIAVVPQDGRVSTAAARAILPPAVPYADAAFTAGRAALLGAALAQGDPTLFGHALHDRLHEPYRAPLSTVYEVACSQPGVLGVTISGSGPTVIVWAHRGEAYRCAEDLGRRLPGARVVPMAVSSQGAGAL
jgi:homoserine kinase